MKTRATPMLCVMLIAGVACAGAHAAKPKARALARSEIPAGFAIGGGEPALALKVEVADGKVTSFASADATAANVTASGSSADGQTMLNIRHDLDVVLKFDLFISSDGERFEYASSCAVTPAISSFEMWEQPIRAFALGNPRVVAQDKMTCE